MKFMKEKGINILKHIDLQRQAIYVDQKFKKSLHILVDGATSASKYIEHTIVQNLLKT